MDPRPASRLALMLAAVTGAMLLAACPRPGAVAPGGPAGGGTPRPAGEPVPPGGQVTAPHSAPPPAPVPTPTPFPVAPTRGVAAGAERWLFHPGPAAGLGDLAAVAARYRLIAIDADPGMKKYTPEQVQALRAGGRNQVLGWLELGSMAPDRPFWKQVGEGNPAFWLGPRAAVPGAQWVDLANSAYQTALVNSLARAIANQGVDGFLLDHVALAEHLGDAADGPCGSGCRQGVLDTIFRLRGTYPDKLLVARGATGDVLRLGTASTRQAIASALDGVVGVQPFGPAPDPDAARELAAWSEMKLAVNGKPLFLGSDEAVPGCDAAQARAAADAARAAGVVPAVRDAATGAACRAE